MFVREAYPLADKKGDSVDVIIQWLEDKFDKEKLVAIGLIEDYFIFLDFQKFCQASMVVQNTVTERMKRSG